MIKCRFLGLAACLLIAPITVSAQSKTAIVSRGPRFEIKKTLTSEGTTVLLFVQNTSAMERGFLADLEKSLKGSVKVGLAVVLLNDLTAPAAQQFMVTATPTAIVYDRFGRELSRTSQPSEIAAAVRKGQLMGRIKWIDEDDPRAPEVYGAPAEALKQGLPGIVKTMSLRPEAYKMFNLISAIHFSDGFLKRREHEMIAAYVSALNKCKF